MALSICVLHTVDCDPTPLGEASQPGLSPPPSPGPTPPLEMHAPRGVPLGAGDKIRPCRLNIYAFM